MSDVSTAAYVDAGSRPATSATLTAAETPKRAPEEVYVWTMVGVGALLWWLAFGWVLMRFTW